MLFRLSHDLMLVRTIAIVAVPCVAFFPTSGLAQNIHTKVEPARAARNTPPPPAVIRPFGIVRQDLFDRNNPNNLGSDYHAPPAQPGQF